ncbi:MAG: cbb3-type cytochrome c oxidase subunit II [Rhodanobacter sp.]
MNKLVLIAGGSTLVYACLALIMGVLPGITLSRSPAGPNVQPLTALQAEGRDVYVANGCSYCHTQQVRPLAQDKVFGRPSMAGDFKYQTPELLGSERTGPDLTNIGVRQPSAVWQYIHLYNPRAVVPESIMPAFDWLFEVVERSPEGVTAVPVPKAYAPAKGVVIPTHKAQALIAYLASLKQPALSAADIAQSAPSMAAMPEPTAPAMAGAGPASVAAGYDPAKAATLFTTHCAACHQANGEGLPGAFPPLKGNAVVNNDDAGKHIDVVLHGLSDAEIDGIKYPSPMPPFADSLSDADIANIIDHERSSWGNHGKPVAAADVAAARSKAK